MFLDQGKGKVSLIFLHQHFAALPTVSMNKLQPMKEGGAVALGVTSSAKRQQLEVFSPPSSSVIVVVGLSLDQKPKVGQTGPQGQW